MEEFQLLIVLFSTLLALGTAVFTRLDRRSERRHGFTAELERRADRIGQAVVELAEAASEGKSIQLARMKLETARAGLSGLMTFPAVEELLAEDEPEQIPAKAQAAIANLSVVIHDWSRVNLHRAMGMERAVVGGRIEQAVRRYRLRRYGSTEGRRKEEDGAIGP